MAIPSPNELSGMLVFACAACGEPMYMTQSQQRVLNRSGKGFQCIYGHGNVWKKPDKATEEEDEEDERAPPRKPITSVL